MKLSKDNLRIASSILRNWVYYIFRITLSRPASYLPEIVNKKAHPQTLTPAEWIKLRKIVKGVRKLSPLFAKKRKCLMEALIAYKSLRMEGIQASFHIGAKKDKQTVSAHAWVSAEGRIIIGGSEGEFEELVRTQKNYR